MSLILQSNFRLISKQKLKAVMGIGCYVVSGKSIWYCILMLLWGAHYAREYIQIISRENSWKKFSLWDSARRRRRRVLLKSAAVGGWGVKKGKDKQEIWVQKSRAAIFKRARHHITNAFTKLWVRMSWFLLSVVCPLLSSTSANGRKNYFLKSIASQKNDTS